MDRNEIAARRASLQEQLRRGEAERQALASIAYEVAELTARHAAFVTSTAVVTTWHWIEAHFPMHAPSLNDQFIDWTRVRGSVRSVGPVAPDPATWLHAVADAQALGNPTVHLFWGLEAAVELRLHDLLANADLVTGRISAWIASPADGWAFQFLPHEWDGWGWGRADRV